MAGELLESVPVVQLSIGITDHIFVYSYNITKQYCSEQLPCRWSGTVYAFLWQSKVYGISRKRITATAQPPALLGFEAVSITENSVFFSGR